MAAGGAVEPFAEPMRDPECRHVVSCKGLLFRVPFKSAVKKVRRTDGEIAVAHSSNRGWRLRWPIAASSSPEHSSSTGESVAIKIWLWPELEGGGLAAYG